MVADYCPVCGNLVRTSTAGSYCPTCNIIYPPVKKQRSLRRHRKRTIAHSFGGY